MGDGLAEDESTEVLVQGHERSPLRMRPTENHTITRIRPQISRLHDVVAAIPQPHGEKVARTPIDQEFHFATVSTASRESFAITAWA